MNDASLENTSLIPFQAWGGLVLMAGISVVLTLLITLGIAWTSPLFVQ